MKDIKKIMVPVDFSEQTDPIIQSAEMIAKKFEATIHVVFVVESLAAYAGFAIPHPHLDTLEKDLLVRAERKMTEFLGDFLDPRTPHTSVILRGNVAAELAGYAKQEGIDLIIIGTRNCKAIEKTLFGSVTERVIKTAPCPVLSMNPCI